MALRVSLEKARWQLGAVWFSLCGLLFAVIAIQSMVGAYGDKVTEAFGWALPNFLPTLSLMISVFGAAALQTRQSTGTFVRSNFLLLSICLSIFYLLLLFLVLLVPIFNALTGIESPTPEVRLRPMEISNIFLGPLQGLVSFSIGVLFFIKEELEN